MRSRLFYFVFFLYHSGENYEIYLTKCDEGQAAGNEHQAVTREFHLQGLLLVSPMTPPSIPQAHKLSLRDSSGK